MLRTRRRLILDGARDRIEGSMWFIPGLFAVFSLLIGHWLAGVRPDPDSPWRALEFGASAGEARALLATISSTTVTVIALTLGLTVVAMQMASTQFSPRLLRRFLRDRPNQVSLGVFIGTFFYATAGLFTVGVRPHENGDYPRLAVSGALVWLFASLAMVVYFANHVAHSIQVDAILTDAEHKVLATIEADRGRGPECDATPVPGCAVAVLADVSGYIQAVHPGWLMPLLRERALHGVLSSGVGDHVVAGEVLCRLWVEGGSREAAEAAVGRGVPDAVHKAVRIGFERTMEQDPGVGMRQLLDSACKALSPAVNDPYTALQAVDHLHVIFRRLAALPLGARRIGDDRASLTIPGRRLEDYLVVVCGHLRRYGSAEPTVMRTVLRLLASCADVTDRPARLRAVAHEARLIAEDAERVMGQPADSRRVRSLATDVQEQVAAKLADRDQRRPRDDQVGRGHQPGPQAVYPEPHDRHHPPTHPGPGASREV